MSKLLEAMLHRINEIVNQENRPFSVLDFRKFEVDGQEYGMRYGTYRNYIVILKKKEEIEFDSTKDGMAYHTLPGKIFGNLMTLDHAGVTPTISGPEKKGSIYKWIKNMPVEKQSIHDIRVVFEAKGIWKVLSAIYPNANVDESSNKDLRLPVWKLIDDIEAAITVHHTDTISIAIACSYRPMAIDANDIPKFFEILVRTEVKLSELVEDSSVIVPHYSTWIVKMWHFGVDEIDEYDKQEFHVTIEEGLGDVFRIYTKRMKDGKLKRRAERQEYPNSSVAQAIIEKLYPDGKLISGRG